MRALLIPPRFASEEETQRARLVHYVTTRTTAIAVVALVAIMLLQSGVALRATVSIAAIALLAVVLLDVNRSGRTALAGAGLVAGLVALVTAFAPSAGGVQSPGVSMYFVFVLLAGLLLGQRGGVITAVACGAIGLVFVVLEISGGTARPDPVYSPVTLWLLNCMYMAVVLVLLRLATDAMAKALARAESELAERRVSEQRLALALEERERLLRSLGERVKELGLLHAAARLLQNERPFDRGVLEELVGLMRQAWPQSYAARVVYRGIEVTTPDWRATPWRLAAPFSTADGDGTVEVAYLEERAPAVEGVFLAEERALIDSLADMLTAYLEQQIGEQRRRGLESQLRQAQKMEALGTLAGGIAHDFNNILTAIGGNAELAAGDVGPDHPARVCLDEIGKAHGRAKDLVRRILLFSRAHEPQRKVIPLLPVVEEAMTLLRASLPAMIEIRVTHEADLPLASVDATQVHQIIMNLGTNAAHAMREHGGTLSVHLDRVEITDVAAAPAADLTPGVYVRVAVRDTGAGMSPAILERLFEPFFTTKGLEGTGLGLSVVHGIVRDHHGAIAVESEVGRGTMFRVYFPASSARATQDEVAARHAPSRKGGHVMYVDDEEAIVFLMSRMLERIGYRVTGFTDAHDALQAFRMNPRGFDAVITDLAMRGSTGLELAREMCAIRPDVRIALASGYADNKEADARESGIALVIRKPADLDTLDRALDTLVHQST